ncbi:hypothetical protein RD792_003509 [Penstemon davidsonii]|uniref:Uncharacterized protein n=1 Tax=Penstemon davidsonii TaxID=160366 RepID=A0ABR0DUF8_9LAMI|nr:hypothetical protein RD792_003509 [Penstemon davidsonii]
MAGAEGRYLNYEKFHASGTPLMKEIMVKIKEASLVKVLEAHADYVFTEDVAEFYRTRKNDLTKMIYVATVGGKTICVSPAVLNEIYDLKNEGGEVFTLGSEKEEEFWFICAKEGEAMTETLMKTQLKDEFQRFADIIAKIFECSTSSLDGLPRRRYQTMVCIYYGLPVNWAVHYFYLLALKKNGHVIMLSHLLSTLGCTLVNGKIVHKLKEVKVYEPVKVEATSKRKAKGKAEKSAATKKPKVNTKAKSADQTVNPAVEARSVECNAADKIVTEVTKEIEEMTTETSPERTESDEPVQVKESSQRNTAAERPVDAVEKAADDKTAEDQSLNKSAVAEQPTTLTAEENVPLIHPTPIAAAPLQIVESPAARRKRTGKAKIKVVTAAEKKRREEEEKKKKEHQHALKLSELEAQARNMSAAEIAAKEAQDLAQALEASTKDAHGPRYSGGIEIGDNKKPRAVMPTPKLPKKKRSELKYALEIVQNDPEVFKQFVADLERYNDILVRQSLFVAEKIRYNRWREYRLTKTKEQIIQWKEFAAEERWVLQFLETGCLRQALDSDHFLDMVHYRLRKLAKSEAKKLQSSVPETPAENENLKERAAKLALSVTLKMWAKKTRYQKGQPSSMTPLPSLQQIVFGPAIKTYEDLPEQTTSPFVPALIFTHKTVVADNGVDVVTEVNEPVQVQKKTDEKISTSSEQLPQQQTTLTDEPKETDKTPEIVPASTAIPSTSASMQPTILESIQQLIANSMKEMEDRHREQLKKFEEVALNLLSAAAADPSPLIVEEIASIKNEVHAIRLDVETFGARVKNNTAGWRDITEVVANAMEAQEEKTESMLKAFTTSADLILSSQIQLCDQVDLTFKKIESYDTLQQLKRENHLLAVDKNIRLLCEEINITPVLPEEPINPADDDKKGEDGGSTSKKGADANHSAEAITQRLAGRLRQECRNIERQIRDIQKEEKSVQKAIKEAAKRNDMGSAKSLAKELVRSRKTVNRLYENKAQLNSISMHLGESVAIARTVGHLSKSAEVMKLVNNLMKGPQVAVTMQEFSKEMTKAGVIEEMMNDAVDDALDSEDIEEETEEEIEKVLTAIAGETAAQLPEAIRRKEKLKQPAATSEEAEENVDDEEELEEIRARLARVRS